MFIDIDGSGPVEITATLYTLSLYEQEFGGDLIKDVFGRHTKDEADEEVLIDMTTNNWNAEIKALWAMVKTAADLKDERGDLAPNDRVPSFKKWRKTVGKINVREIADAVVEEALDGFFHTGAAVSE